MAMTVHKVVLSKGEQTDFDAGKDHARISVVPLNMAAAEAMNRAGRRWIISSRQMGRLFTFHHAPSDKERNIEVVVEWR